MATVQFSMSTSHGVDVWERVSAKVNVHHELLMTHKLREW